MKTRFLNQGLFWIFNSFTDEREIETNNELNTEILFLQACTQDQVSLQKW